MSNCKGCGATLPERTAPGRERKWCSDKCRKRTLYSGVCIDCGGRTDATASGHDRVAVRCNACAIAVNVAITKAASRLYRDEVIALYAEGLTACEMAEQVGVTTGSMSALLTRMRREGEPLPYRRKETPASRAAYRQLGQAAAIRLARERAAA